MIDDIENDRRFATTLAKGLSVLRAFRSSDDGLGNGEIAERTGIPKSTVSRLTFTLQALGYLTHTRKRDRYRPGPALLALGNIATASISIVELSDGIMQRLADETGTLSTMLVRDNRKLLIVKTWRPRDVSSIWLEVGHRIPMLGSSSGLAFLAALSEEAFGRIEAGAGFDAMPPGTNPQELRRGAYSQLIARGFVIAPHDHYYAPHINAVAKPFYSGDINEPIIFSSGATKEALSLERAERVVGPKLVAAIQELEHLSGQVPGLMIRG